MPTNGIDVFGGRHGLSRVPVLIYCMAVLLSLDSVDMYSLSVLALVSCVNLEGE